jgi:hypothetical protein
MSVVFTPRALVSSFFLASALAGCSSEALDSGEPEAGAPSEGRVVGVVAPEATSPSPAVQPNTAQPDYPPGPYGAARGATIANLSFLGWRDPVAAGYSKANFETIRLSDFYNPTKAAGGPRVLVLNASAVWCSVCRAEYTHLARDQVYAKYRPKGIEILGIIFEDNDGFPARPQDLELWGGKNGYQVVFPFVIDPGFKSGVSFDSDATPMNMIVDTSTMTILKIDMGFDSSTPEAYWADIETWIGN